ncbi:MAG: hypothetical protein LBK59_00210, partial [Bifidobacteriaceae bacterium]|nr:hypothetical protein [Bifidobacteriaceae bacterium]
MGGLLAGMLAVQAASTGAALGNPDDAVSKRVWVVPALGSTQSESLTPEDMDRLTSVVSSSVEFWQQATGDGAVFEGPTVLPAMDLSGYGACLP